MLTKRYGSGIPVPGLISMRRRRGCDRLILFVLKNGGKIPVIRAHQLVGPPDFINRFGTKLTEVAWFSGLIWSNGCYLHDHALAMMRKGSFYRNPRSNRLSVIAIQLGDGRRLPWGWRFTPRRTTELKWQGRVARQ